MNNPTEATMAIDGDDGDRQQPVSDDEIHRTHAVFDRANVPRAGVDTRTLSLEQRANILMHWYQRGRK